MKRISISITLILATIAAGLYGFLLLKSLRKSPEKTSDVSYTTVLVAPLHPQEFQEKFSGYGVASALQETEVRSQITGVVRWISPRLKLGKKVKEGETLVELDQRDLKRPF